jgi:hypothetical protein
MACCGDHGEDLIAASEREEARRSIEHHRKVFDDLLGLAHDALRKRQHRSAAVYAQIGALYAWLNHPAIFASHALEEIARTAGLDAVPRAAVSRRPSAGNGRPRRVLHVMSEAHDIGGHTRLVWRWIRRDAGGSHSVVLTNQRRQTVPRALADAARPTGGTVHLLDDGTRDVLRRARRLRDLARSSDHVVLHVHPYDVVPIIAFAAREGLPPITFLNHADHVFWVGASISDIVAHTRHSGLRLSQRRRGIVEERCALIPLPLAIGDRAFSRVRAKELIGVASATPVLLSIGSAYKYAPVHAPSFSEILASILEENHQAILLVIGPTDEGPWAEAARRTQGRIRTLGVQGELSAFYQAADIFVDSFPLCSETALLEAATYGVVPVRYCPHPPEAEVLCTDAPGIEPHLLRARTLDEYRAFLSRLIRDGAYRSALGERIRRAVLEVHCGDTWRRFAEEAYLRAAAVASARQSAGWTGAPQGTSFDELDILVDRLHIKGDFSRRFDQSVQAHLRLLPPHLRLWWQGKMFGWGGYGRLVGERLGRAFPRPRENRARFEDVLSDIASGKRARGPRLPGRSAEDTDV